MQIKTSYIAELLGTFVLSLSIVLSVASNGAFMPIPVLAGLALAFLVYTIGFVSGCHLNPAMTLGIWSVKKIAAKEALPYIIAQFIGAGLAVLVAKIFGLVIVGAPSEFSLQLLLAESAGAAIFGFGVASVVFEKVRSEMSGIVIGGSLVLGIMIATFMGAAGILNPAVSLALNSLSLVYVLSPIVGVIIAMQLYHYFVKKS